MKSQWWLYQMSAELWPERRYRQRIWESSSAIWPTGRIAGSFDLQEGDRLMCFYAPSGSEAPGICGWGVITHLYAEYEQFEWRPTPPSDLLKMKPLYDDAIYDAVKTIRGGFPQGTMW